MATAPAPLPLQQLAEVQEAASRAGCPALVQSAHLGRHDVLSHLLHLADHSPDHKTMAFLAAAGKGHTLCLHVLLEASAPSIKLVQAMDNLGRTALAIAASRGHVGCVQSLKCPTPTLKRLQASALWFLRLSTANQSV